MKKYNNLDNRGRFTVSSDKKNAPEVDRALDWLHDELGLNRSKATGQALILYAQDCGMPVKKDQNAPNTQ